MDFEESIYLLKKHLLLYLVKYSNINVNKLDQIMLQQKRVSN